MTESWWNDAEQDPTHEAAAEWFAKLQRADVSAEELLAWQRWLAADARNAEAFARLEDVCAMLREVPRPAGSGASRGTTGKYDGTEPISDWRDRRRSRGWVAIAASLAAAAVLIAGGWSVWNRQSASEPRPEIVQTGVGENRTVQLPDGSRVTLGGNTLLSASFNDRGRHVELARGEALFVVAKDRTRPFSVQAGKATVTAVGTQFNVRRREDRVDVAVVEGEVIVQPVAAGSLTLALPLSESETGGRKPVRVAAGEKAVVGDAGVQSTSRFADADAPIAWRSGRLVFEREPLREVVEDVNRYSRKQLAIEDERIGELMFTGTVVNGNVDGWIASIEDVFSLEAVEASDRIVLRRRKN